MEPARRRARRSKHPRPAAQTCGALPPRQPRGGQDRERQHDVESRQDPRDAEHGCIERAQTSGGASVTIDESASTSRPSPPTRAPCALVLTAYPHPSRQRAPSHVRVSRWPGDAKAQFESTGRSRHRALAVGGRPAADRCRRSDGVTVAGVSGRPGHFLDRGADVRYRRGHFLLGPDQPLTGDRPCDARSAAAQSSSR